MVYLCRTFHLSIPTSWELHAIPFFPLYHGDSRYLALRAGPFVNCLLGNPIWLHGLMAATAVA